MVSFDVECLPVDEVQSGGAINVNAFGSLFVRSYLAEVD